MIDLEAVVALRAVATNGSVAAAADALGFTPSAVSQQSPGLPPPSRQSTPPVAAQHSPVALQWSVASQQSRG